MNSVQENRQKLLGYEFYEKILGRPRFVMAPMVDGSELAYRLLARRYGAELCYTPMIGCKEFVESEKIRHKSFQTCLEDQPLIVQFCGRDPESLLAAATLVQHHCQAVDINLGCPQLCAKRGGYGAYLMLEPQLVYEIVRTLHTHLIVPVTCKIRLYPEREGGVAATIKFAQGLKDHGCQLLTVHGRTREQKGHTQGHANWEAIREIRRHVRGIPIIANGSVETFDDISHALSITECEAVMSASGILRNPALFSGKSLSPFEMIREYLNLTEVYPTPRRYIINHIYSILHDYFDMFPHFRPKVHTSRSLTHYRELVSQLESLHLNHTHSHANEIDTEDPRNLKQQRFNTTEKINNSDCDDAFIPF